MRLFEVTDPAKSTAILKYYLSVLDHNNEEGHVTQAFQTVNTILDSLSRIKKKGIDVATFSEKLKDPMLKAMLKYMNAFAHVDSGMSFLEEIVEHADELFDWPELKTIKNSIARDKK